MKNSLIFSEKVHHCFFQTVEVSVHEACFDVHPGMSAGKKGLTGKTRKENEIFSYKFDFLHIDQGH